MPRATVLIADDEPLVRRSLRRVLGDRRDVEIVGEAADGAEAVELVEQLRPMILLLDVQMPVLDGLAVARALSSPRPAIVFATAFDRYAIDAFRVHAVDYVLKPFDDERLHEALDRAIAQCGERGPALDRLLEAVAPRYLTRFLVRTGTKLQVVRLDDVEWLEAADNYVRVHAADATRVVRGSLQEIATSLDPAVFVRVHRTAIVRIDAVVEVASRPSSDAELLLRSGARVPLSRQLRSSVLARIGREG
jgi:DNA-binding LytR/AlgR family response regulator